jgi:hypothetical protein
MQRTILICGLMGAAILIANGCGQSEEAKKHQQGGEVSTGGSVSVRYLLGDEPPGAKGVLDVKQAAKDGDEVLVVGRVGGSKKPLLDGLAGFTIVDPTLKQCSERPGDDCDTPWDYCCEDPAALARATVLVKLVDEHGKTLKQDARKMLGVEPLQTVVVRGKAKRDADGNLSVLAAALHIRGTQP